MNVPAPAEFYNPNQTFMGSAGVILFGEDNEKALSYFRCGNTQSYPYHVDLAGGGRETIDGRPESPYETFAREAKEEFGIKIIRHHIEYARVYPSLIDSSVIGWFTVARANEALCDEIKFGDEGLFEQITSLNALVNHPLLIPRRRLQIENYLADSKTALSQAA